MDNRRDSRTAGCSRPAVECRDGTELRRPQGHGTPFAQTRNHRLHRPHPSARIQPARRRSSTSRTTRAIPCSTPKNWERPSAKAPCYTRKSLSGTYFWTRQKSISILRETGNSTSRSSSPDWAATPPNRRAPRGWPSATCGFPTRASCSATKGPTPSPRESISEIWCSTDSTSGATDSISTGEPSRWISPPCHSATSAASRSATSPQTSSPWATA